MAIPFGPAPTTANVGMMARITRPVAGTSKPRLEHAVAWKEE
jgi:hypothetical protein